MHIVHSILKYFNIYTFDLFLTLSKLFFFSLKEAGCLPKIESTKNAKIRFDYIK
jgi:hypothetical protein